MLKQCFKSSESIVNDRIVNELDADTVILACGLKENSELADSFYDIA